MVVGQTVLSLAPYGCSCQTKNVGTTKSATGEECAKIPDLAHPASGTSRGCRFSPAGALRDAARRRRLLRASGSVVVFKRQFPLTLRRSLLLGPSRRVRFPFIDSPSRYLTGSPIIAGRQPNATRLSCSCVAGVCAERHRTSREVDVDVLQLRVLGEYRSTALCRSTCHQPTAVTGWWRSSPPAGGSTWDAPADRVTPLASGVRGRAGWLVGP